MSLYELEILRGTMSPLEDGYKEYYRARERKVAETLAQEQKPYQFGLLEYVKQANLGTVEIDETFFREFYTLSEEEQTKVIVHLEQHTKNYTSLRGDGRDLGIEGYIPFNRLRSFIDQWLKGVTEEWVTHMMVRAQTRVPLQERERESEQTV